MSEARLFAVPEAYYMSPDQNNWVSIAGVPEFGQMYFGEYSGKYPNQAASKAFTGLQKHIKKFSKGDWFPDVDPENPPEIIFKLVDVETQEGDYYHGVRVPAHQGERVVVNAKDGRVRRYKWDNKVRKISNLSNISEVLDQY